MTVGIFGPFELDNLDRWFDASEQLGAEAGECILVCDPDIGALIFSAVSKVADPESADVRPEDLAKRLLEEQVHLIDKVFDVVATYSDLNIGAMSFISDDVFVRLWKFSDTHYVADAMYTCPSGKEGIEIPDCEAVIRTIKFSTMEA